VKRCRRSPEGDTTQTLPRSRPMYRNTTYCGLKSPTASWCQRMATVRRGGHVVAVRRHRGELAGPSYELQEDSHIKRCVLYYCIIHNIVF